LTSEGYHAARSTEVTPKSVMKIRLTHGWYAPFEQVRGADTVGAEFTVNGLAKELAVNESTIYRLIYRHIIPAELVRQVPHTGIYLIQPDPALLEHVREHIATQKRRNGIASGERHA
jgi:hypothetical protein